MTDTLNYLSSIVMETADNLATGIYLNDEAMFGNYVCDSTGQVKLGGNKKLGHNSSADDCS